MNTYVETKIFEHTTENTPADMKPSEGEYKNRSLYESRFEYKVRFLYSS